MIRILKVGEEKREKAYFKVTCPYCRNELTFELKDVWIDDALGGVGRIECPVPGCRSKVHMKLPGYPIMDAKIVDKEVYDNAYSDTSKSGFQILMENKKKEDEENECNADS